MNKRVTGGMLLLAVLKKDVRVYSRNMIYLFLTILSLVAFVTIFWLVPDTVEEELTFAVTPSLNTLLNEGKEALEARGVSGQVTAQLDQFEATFEEEGLLLVEFETEEQLKLAVSGEIEVYRTEQGQFVIHDPEGSLEKPSDAKKVSLSIGISFPSTFFSDVMLKQKPRVTVFADAAVPEEIRGAMQGFIRELAYQLAGNELPVEFPAEDTIILGRDRLGEQISMRSRMRPLIAFFIMMMETFAL
ncbi:MAG: hypothetical protein U1E11_02125, partial [Dethiobacteria bacterium]|nr:hypothetical protein [Dethiobacteria bacterium]